MKHIFRIYKPNIGLQSKTEILSSLKEKGKKIRKEQAEKIWCHIHETSQKSRGHILSKGTSLL